MPARDSFSPDDEPRILAALAAHFSLRDAAMIIVGMDTGYRARELGSMQISHVWAEDLGVKEKIVLERRHLKNGTGAYRRRIQSRAVPLTPRSRAAIGQYISERLAVGPLAPEAPLFLSRQGLGLSIWQINRIVHAVADQAGCAPDRLYGSHSLRRTFAQRVHIACGRDLNLTRIALGHGSVLVTQRYLSEERDKVDAAILGLGGAHAACCP